MTLVTLWLASACTLSDQRPADASRGSIVAWDRVLWSVNPWDQTLVAADIDHASARAFDVDGEPTQLARVGDALWVTLRADGTVGTFGVDDAGPYRTSTIDIGAEPYGLAVTPDHARVFVSVSQEGAVLELDAATQTIERRFELGGEPRWLSMHPSGRAVFVSYGLRSGATRIDLESGTTTEIHVPHIVTGVRDPVLMSARSTGESAISTTGAQLVLPTTYADNTTPGAQPELDGPVIAAPPVPYYTDENGTMGLVRRLNPSLVVVDLDPETGTPTGPSRAYLLVGLDQRGSVRGNVSAATFVGEDQAWAALDAADALIAVDLVPFGDQGNDLSMVNGSGNPGEPAWSGFTERIQVPLRTAGNPRSLLWSTDGHVYVYEAGGRSVSWFDTAAIDDQFRRARKAAGLFVPERVSAAGTLSAGTSRLDVDVEAGRRLFMSAMDPRISQPGAGVSCNSCHVDGRTDGLTWAFDDDPRQTPVLVGATETEPVTWTDDVPTVAREAQITAIGRMGGLGLTDEEAEQVAIYLSTLRDIVRPAGDPAAVARGAEIFSDPTVGCADCHTGDRFTDQGRHVVFGSEIDTPSLRGLGASPPYLHDGSAATLRELLESALGGGMGAPRSLSNAELDDLESFLETL